MYLGTLCLMSLFFPLPNSTPPPRLAIHLMFFYHQIQSHEPVQIYRLIMFILMHVYHLVLYGLLSCCSRKYRCRLPHQILAQILVSLHLLTSWRSLARHELTPVPPLRLPLMGHFGRLLLWLVCHHVAVHYLFQLLQPLHSASLTCQQHHHLIAQKIWFALPRGLLHQLADLVQAHLLWELLCHRFRSKLLRTPDYKQAFGNRRFSKMALFAMATLP
jgi:hypothetical protein